MPLFLDNANSAARVLVVDDDPHLRSLISTTLTKAGFRVDNAKDGAEAWMALSKASYNLLITDQQMRMLTGLELIRALRSSNKTLPVILVSGTLPIEEINRRPELCINATLPKPFKCPELLDTVRRVLSPQVHPPAAEVLVKSETGFPTAESVQTSNRILVVDDDSLLRGLSVSLLTAANYDAEGVEDGAAGWAALQANKNYDLVITDNQMPKMTGIDLIEKVRSARMTTRVIMATGSLPTNEFARRPWLQPDATLQRPYTNEDLLETVSSVLRTEKRNGATNAT